MGYVCKDRKHKHSRDTCTGPLEWDGKDANPASLLYVAAADIRDQPEPQEEQKIMVGVYVLTVISLSALVTVLAIIGAIEAFRWLI